MEAELRRDLVYLQIRAHIVLFNYKLLKEKKEG